MRLGLYLRILSFFYFIGFALHVADLFDLRLNFSEMDSIWRTWIVFLTIADFLTSVFLWRLSPIGVWLLLLVAGAQLVAYTAFQSMFGSQWFLVTFHAVTVFILFLIPSLKTQVDLAKVEVPTGQPRAVGSFFKMMYAYLFRGISFQEAAWTMWSTVAYVNEDTRKSYGERRFNLVALSRKGRALHITFTKRSNAEITRIISVRRANKKERKKLQEKFPEATIE
jgi:uncharacterized DUF497 family protein